MEIATKTKIQEFWSTRLKLILKLATVTLKLKLNFRTFGRLDEN